MATLAKTQVIFPLSERDLFPLAAQQLYIETYNRSFAESGKGNSDPLLQARVAAQDAWNAVGRLFEQDFATHKWRIIGEPVETNSILKTIKSLFKR